MTVQTLTQDELDNAYHKAIFDCDQALADVIRRRFYHRQEQIVGKGVPLYLWDTIRDELHNELAAAFNDCELQHMGAQRYDALMGRLLAQLQPEGSPQ